MKRVKKYACASLFAVVLIFTSGAANAEISNVSISSDPVITVDDCVARAELVIVNGDKVKIEGSCRSVVRQIKRYKRKGLIK